MANPAKMATAMKAMPGIGQSLTCFGLILLVVIGGAGVLLLAVVGLLLATASDQAGADADASSETCAPAESVETAGGGGEWEASVDEEVSGATTPLDVPSEYEDLIAEAAETANFPEEVVAATIQQENRSWETGESSHAGAMGIAQFMPGTWDGLIENGLIDSDADPMDPDDAIPAMGEYLNYLREQVEPHSDSLNETVELTLASYNAGHGAVADAGWSVPDIPETRSYVVEIFWMLNEAGSEVSGGSSSCTPSAPDIAGLTCDETGTENQWDLHVTTHYGLWCAEEAIDQGWQVTSGKRGSDTNSDHFYGQAVDFGPEGWAGNDLTYSGFGLNQEAVDVGDELALLFLENAEELDVRYIIWFDEIWRCGDDTDQWLPYNGNPHDASNLHIDHVHVSFDRSGGHTDSPCPS